MSEYQDLYRQKLTDAASIAARVESGWVIGMDAATAHTPKIISALAERARKDEIRNVKVQTLLDVYPLEFYAYMGFFHYSGTQTPAVACRLSCSTACGILVP